jgi:hypothetical protein
MADIVPSGHELLRGGLRSGCTPTRFQSLCSRFWQWVSLNAVYRPKAAVAESLGLNSRIR